ncbi:MAG: flagellar export protein FliJ [Planctomycetaceae bacterium TMED240]|nr:flagellar export protein FliJ [Rhodopirellula sp.]OUX07362.1 MAG: flagellar export protein FliJ [Planctomycetaceae bacterium TMED240]
MLPADFRFKSLLDLRRQQRDEAGAALGQANEAIAKVNTQIDEIKRERIALRDTRDVNRQGNVSVDALLAHGRYDLQLQADMGSLEATMEELTAEMERRRVKLVEAEAELKRFEKLKEYDEAEFRALESKREHAESDEVSTRRYILQRQR